MPSPVSTNFEIAAPPQPPRKRWTRSECAALEVSGIWDQQRLELVDGELITKKGKKRPHVNSLTLIFTALRVVFGGQYVESNSPIDVAPEDNPANEPEPDLIVLTRASREIRSGNPQPADLRLVIEISDSSLKFDLTIKASLYARAGIPEYWILDTVGRKLIVHRDPQAGAYQFLASYSDQESVSPLAAPHAVFAVKDAFPE